MITLGATALNVPNPFDAIESVKTFETFELKYQLPKLRIYIVNESGITPEMYAVRCASDVADFLEPIRHLAEEHFVSLLLNAKNEILGMHEVSHGTLSSSLVHPREVFKAAFLANSHAIIVCHNHPSGSPIIPSKEDIATTKQLIHAGQVLNVEVLDHVILSPVHALYSIRDHHPELWQEGAETRPDAALDLRRTA